MMSKHRTDTDGDYTPGPWFADNRWPRCIMAKDNEHQAPFMQRVAEVHYASDADRRLMEMAPELLEAAKAYADSRSTEDWCRLQEVISEIEGGSDDNEDFKRAQAEERARHPEEQLRPPEPPKPDERKDYG